MTDITDLNPDTLQTLTDKTAKSLINPDTHSDLISVVEIFGPTIQGEGALIGTPTLFVRTGGCDYRCSWCDTGYAVLPDYAEQWQSLTAHDILQRIDELSAQQPLWITLSGGNPAQQPLGELIRLGQAKGYRFSMETQGSIASDWFANLDQLTLSPKPPSSGMQFKHKGFKRCLDACGDQVDISLKFVVADEADLLWARNIADQYPSLPCFVQPCNTHARLESELNNSLSTHQATDDTAYLRQRMLWLIDACQKMHWHTIQILPQFHVWLWGNEKGK